MLFDLGRTDSLCKVFYYNNNSSSMSKIGDIIDIFHNNNCKEDYIIDFILNNIDNKNIERVSLFKGTIMNSTPFIEKTFVGTALKEPLQEDDVLRIIVKGSLGKEWIVLNVNTSIIEKLFRMDRKIKSVKAYKGFKLIKMMERD